MTVEGTTDVVARRDVDNALNCYSSLVSAGVENARYKNVIRTIEVTHTKNTSILQQVRQGVHNAVVVCTRLATASRDRFIGFAYPES